MQSCTNSLVVETMFNNVNAKDQFLIEVTENINLEGTPPDIQTNGTRYLLIKMVRRYSVEVCPGKWNLIAYEPQHEISNNLTFWQV